MIFQQIFNMVNVGIVILDKELNIYQWNRWMEIYSRIPSDKIIGSSIFDYFPKLNNSWFLRNCRSVFTFGNFAFFSQKLHKYCFPFNAISPFNCEFENMQQSCTLGPLRNEDNKIEYIYIMVQDVTEIVAYEKKLVEMSIKDGLTGLYNRKYFTQRINEEFNKYKRYNKTFSLLIQDIDFFKNVNDTYGHQAGDYVLKELSKLISSRVRNTDIVARYGGEEFCCLLPETDMQSATVLAEDLRSIVKAKVFTYNKKNIRITLSQGVAEVSPYMDSFEPLIKIADDALYKAKQTGRNKVMK